MNRRIISLSVGIISLAAGSMPTLAGDWNNGAGSLKDRGNAAVPVPAPISTYDGPSGWYMRLDAGIGREGKRGAKESGVSYGAGNGIDSYSSTGAGFGSSGSWFTDSSDANFIYGGGVGYRWNSNWRSDLTLEHRTVTEYKMRGTYQYNNNVINPIAPFAPLYVAPVPQTRINGVSNDNTEMKSGVLMANTYYDWKNRSAFTPYIGGGLGLAYVSMHRNHTTTDTSCDTTEVPIPCATTAAHRSFSGSGVENRLLWAGSLTTGFSYAMTSVTSLDVNYRMLYIPSSNVDMSLAGSNSRFSYNDIFEHQIRAGLRWDIN